jgi:acetyl-CoA C-acetyltransferase
MREVAVIGVGLHRFGELWDRSLRDLMLDASLKALDDAGIERLDAIVLGSMGSGGFADQEHGANLLADTLGMGPLPATRVEAACASGGMAVRAGFAEVAAGISDVVLVAGVEKMTDVSGMRATALLAQAADQDYEAFHGVTFPGLNAMIARAYMHKHGAKSAQLAAVAVKNHRHGSLNPLAQFRAPLTVEAVLASPMVADPLHMFDCAPVSDGAAALVLCPVAMAASLSKRPPVRITGIGAATDRIALYRHEDLTRLPAAAEAAKAAYAMAGRTPEEIDVAELHDAFTIMEVCSLEELGFCEVGRGAEAAPSGLTALDGRIPVNPSGGLKARGHPVGATGVSQVGEIVTQLRGDAGDRQVPGARVGLAENIGGSGGTVTVAILEGPAS